VGIKSGEFCRDFGQDGFIIRNTSYGCEIDCFEESRCHLISDKIPESQILFRSSDSHLELLKNTLSDRDLLIQAISMFNCERYWEYHELLERIWKSQEGNAKRYIQCLILVGVSQVKYQMNQPNIGKTVYSRALREMSRLNARLSKESFPECFRYPLKIHDADVREMLENNIMKNII
jgi:hypothetical protein